MTMLMRVNAARLLVGALVGAAALLGTARTSRAITLDANGDMTLGLRAYTAVRVGTEKIGSSDNPLNYPESGAGHLRQHRYFLQLDFDHDLRRAAREGWGLAALFRWIDPSTLKYSLTYRGEGEGIYDYGPDEYHHFFGKDLGVQLNLPNVPALGVRRTIPVSFAADRSRILREEARQRHRLFLAYLDFEKGPLFIRLGRQVLAWGETDVFRLLDNINPLDNSFGGFFIALDERRVPITMLRSSWNFGDIGPLQDSFLEGFVGDGNRISFDPAIPAGSPWNPGGIAYPNPSIKQIIHRPDPWDVRGGGRFVFTFKDVTTTLAHYWTYLDVPGSQFQLPSAKLNNGFLTTLPTAANPLRAHVRYPRVPITGASVTFPLTRFYTIVRSEAAMFWREPLSRQGVGDPTWATYGPGTPQAAALRQNAEGGVDPFVYPTFGQNPFLQDGTGPFVPGRAPNGFRRGSFWGTVLQRKTFNYSLGFDINRFIHWLNPTQTFFISTQFFYRHVFDSPGDLVLATPFRSIPVSPDFPVAGVNSANNPLGTGCYGKTQPCALRPRFYHVNDNSFRQTLLITTSYSGGRILPSMGMFYDWQGAWVFQPGVTLVRDPFRVTMDYTAIVGAPTGEFGTVRDRDNVRFQVEYVF